MSATTAKAKPKSKADKASAASSHTRNGADWSARQAMPKPGRPGAFYSAGPAFSLGVPVQAKLVVGAPDDAYEREADEVAETVMRMPQLDAAAPPDDDEEKPLQTKPLIQRQQDLEEEGEEEEEPIQTTVQRSCRFT